MNWVDDYDLPYATVTGLFGETSEVVPDISTLSGTVTFTPTVTFIKVDGAVIKINPVVVPIRSGTIVGTDGTEGVRILATDIPNDTVDNWGWRATFKVENLRIPPVTFYAESGSDIDLSRRITGITGLPVEIVEGPQGIQGPQGPQGEIGPQGPKGDTGDVGPQGDKGDQGIQGPKGDTGVSVTDVLTINDRSMSLLLSDGEETSPVQLPVGPQGEQGPTGEKGEQGIQGIPGPEGERGLQGVQGERGPDGPVGPEGPQGPKGDTGETGPKGEQGLKGDTGPVSTVPGPPGTVLTPESMLVVGPGRPDAPTTTGMTSEALAALPVGAEYRSTDGASVGAWVWRKRPTGWVVTEGDTLGRIMVDDVALLPLGGVAVIRRVGSRVNLVLTEIPREYGQPVFSIPAGFRANNIANLAGSAKQGGASYQASTLIGYTPSPNFRFLGDKILFHGTAVSTGLSTHYASWEASDPWPTVLPGGLDLYTN